MELTKSNPVVPVYYGYTWGGVQVQLLYGLCRGDVMRVKDNCANVADYDPTVKDSPHPQASLILGFLKANFELHKFD